MADVVNRATKQHRISVNTPDFPVSEWIINPDMSKVRGLPMKYWKVVGDEVLPMTLAEQVAVDLAEPTPPPSEEEKLAALTLRVENLEAL